MIQEFPVIKAIIGSHAYGTSVIDSDTDYMGVRLASEDVYLGLNHFGKEGTIQEKNVLTETTTYEFKKFIRLCSKFNPNVIPLLYLPLDKYIHISDFGLSLINNRDMFNSRLAYHAFVGFAYGQIQKMEHPACPTGQMGAKRKGLRDSYGYDTKNLYHAIRLSRMLNEFLENGYNLIVNRTGIDADELVAIRFGSLKFDEAKSMALDLLQKAKGKIENSDLPFSPDQSRIDEFVRSSLRRHLAL